MIKENKNNNMNTVKRNMNQMNRKWIEKWQVEDGIKWTGRETH